MRVAWLLCALATLVSGCQDDGGAVSVRWHIVDLTTGELINPRDHGGPNGSCVYNEPDMSSLRSWVIEDVELVITDINDGDPSAPDGGERRLPFGCSQAEATTPFTLPTGTFAMSLFATSTETEVITPAPALRAIKRAEVVNLDVVEIGVHPLPLATPTPDMAAPADLGVPADLSVDAAPVM